MIHAASTLCDWSAPPIDPPWPHDLVHVWCGVFADEQDDQHWASMATVLSDDERARAGRFHFARDRRWFIARRSMVRRILSGYLGMPPEALRFAAGPHGKPEVLTRAGARPIAFSVSHSNGIALCALASGRRVGIDVERVRPMMEMEQVVARVSSAEELSMFRRLPESSRERAFFELWTRKEAYVKARGVGLSAALDAFTVAFGPARPQEVLDWFDMPVCWSLVSFRPAPAFEAALCIEGRERGIACWRFTHPHATASDPPTAGETSIS